MKNFASSEEKNISGILVRSALEEVLRDGARRMLQQAIESEVIEYVQRFQNLRNEMNQRLVKRNGHLPVRDLLTGIGPINIRQPRVRDERPGERFSSDILPKYKRRTQNIERLIPELYLRGISTTNFPEALSAIFGENAHGLSASNIMRMKEIWEKEYRDWNERRFEEIHYVYLWADGIYFNIRLEEDRPCLLVLMGATKDGRKELIGIHDGNRESKQSWKDFLQHLKSRGLSIDPSLAVGDGALGFWSALEEEFPRCRQHGDCLMDFYLL